MKSHVLCTASDLLAATTTLAAATHIGCDTETSSLDARRGRLLSIQFSDGENAYLVPTSEGVGLGPLAAVLADPTRVKIFHNAKFDLKFLQANGFTLSNVFCTLTAERVLTKGADQSCSLAETLYRYFGVDLNKSLRAKFTGKWDGIWTPALVEYALTDVVYLPELYHRQVKWLQQLGLSKNYLREALKSGIIAAHRSN